MLDPRNQHSISQSLYRPQLQMVSMNNSRSGHDAGARSSGFTQMPTGVPHKPRHQAFLGIEKRPGTIRL